MIVFGLEARDTATARDDASIHRNRCLRVDRDAKLTIRTQLREREQIRSSGRMPVHIRARGCAPQHPERDMKDPPPWLSSTAVAT